ncbi:MAG: hypothetical protein KGN76_05360 [Acidobacteriota bacterium]|nr:hypothetical protein [Acidobacteriota bacterium]
MSDRSGRAPLVTSGEGGSPFPRPSTLDWLLAPVSSSLFFERYWERQPLVVTRQAPDHFSGLLSLDEIDRVITTLDRRYPDICLKDARRDLAAEDYTVDGEVLDVARLYQLFGEGATITLAFLDTVVPHLTAFCRGLERVFTCPLQANVYLTPPGAQGARPHYDTHDVFVLQVSGSKHWVVYGTPLELPLPAQDFDADVHELGEKTLEFELQAGDVAYIPRGVTHEARSTDETSLHITAGVLRYTWLDLLLELVAHTALHDPAFRRALPPGFAYLAFDRESARPTLDDLLGRVSASTGFDQVLDGFADEFLASSPPLLRGQMGQLAVLHRLTADSVVGVRPGAMTAMRRDGQALSVHCYGRRITFPQQAADAVRFALSRTRFVVRDLPGPLDQDGKLTLVKRLIREGLVLSL